MAYLYKTILRRENHDFDICQNRYNSLKTSIIAVSKKDYKTEAVGVQNNKTGEIKLYDHKFKEATIAELKKRLELA